MSNLVRRELLQGIESVLNGDSSTLIIHSSLAKLAPPKALEKWDALFSIARLLNQGYTLAFPSFTFSFCQTGTFDRERTNSETGILSDWVRTEFPNAIRTDHPIYSFVVIGPFSSIIADCPCETTFGDTSTFGLFEKLDAQVIMLGCGWEYATPFHRYEEKASVPYRYFKTFHGVLIRNGEGLPTSSTMYVRNRSINAIINFSTLVKDMRSSGAITSAQLWHGQVESASMSSISESASRLLEKNILEFVANAAHVQCKIDLLLESKQAKPFRIGLLGRSNLDIAAQNLRNRLENLLPSRKCEVNSTPFAQLTQEVISSDSELARFRPEMVIFADRLEDLLGLPGIDQASPHLIIEAAQEHANLIRRFAETSGALVVVHRLAFSQHHTIGRMAELRGLVDKCNLIMKEVLADVPSISWIDIAAEATCCEAAIGDLRLWHLGRIPFSKQFSDRLVERWSGIVLATLGKTTRVIVLDLDNTIWGGVLGEDGLEGILIGGDFPGNAFSHFQATLKALSKIGIGLAICSKNDEDLALHAIGSHKEMILTHSDIISHRINWLPKWQNIIEIANELNIGLGSIMFIDDNEVEREAVRRNLPMVTILELPADPTSYADALLASPFIESIQTCQEDLNRIKSYKVRENINQERGKAANIDEFLRGLKMKLYIQPLDESNILRAAQLCQKTNQFNTTTYRYSPSDLSYMKDMGVDVAVIGFEDKLSQRENIGLILLKQVQEFSITIGEIDLFLLSCRVLGRTIEKAVLDWAVSRAYARGWDYIDGIIIETPRNRPVRNLFFDYGFSSTSKEGRWRHAAVASTTPDCFDLYDSFK